jgi:hypothetical protein
VEYLGEHKGRKVYWWRYAEDYDDLPVNNWICFALADTSPEYDVYSKFVRAAIDRNILEYKVQGCFSEKLHDEFDEIVVLMEVLENHADINAITTWHHEGPASTFWQCFYATSFTLTPECDDLKIICVDFDNADKRKEITNYLKRINEGWLPSEEE